jgi:hypothetical protein
MATKLIAGPCPDGGFVSRRTDNDYEFAVAILDDTERVYDRKGERKDGEAYPTKPNKTFGQFIGISWHRRYDLAAKRIQQLQNRGVFGAVIVPVVHD